MGRRARGRDGGVDGADDLLDGRPRFLFEADELGTLTWCEKALVFLTRAEYPTFDAQRTDESSTGSLAGQEEDRM